MGKGSYSMSSYFSRSGGQIQSVIKIPRRVESLLLSMNISGADLTGC